MREKNTFTLEIKKNQTEGKLSQREKIKKEEEKREGHGKF